MAAESYRSVRGMRDLYGEEVRHWRHCADVMTEQVRRFGYEEIQLPVLEATGLFARGVGEATDIVEKEMYSLKDRDGDSMSLRPEGTAGCVRALIQHGLLHNQTQRVFYSGPMFRYERPQRGRYRQFEQIGVEAFGLAGPDVDVELIALGAAMWRALGVSDHVRLEINTLGSGAARRAYRDALVDYLTPHAASLDADSQRRLSTNPLRILDSKDAATREIVADAPALAAFVDASARAHFDALQEGLTALGIEFRVNPRLVRGLDYYTHTVFEWITDDLGAQGTVCGGGRYDALVSVLGGRDTPAAGFALGVDRVALLWQTVAGQEAPAAVDVYCCVMDHPHAAWAMQVADVLRERLGCKVRVHAGGGKLKNQMKRADQSGAQWALVIGEDEVANATVTLKPLREAAGQESLDVERLLSRLSDVR